MRRKLWRGERARARARTPKHLIEAARVLTLTGLLSAPFIPAWTHSLTSAVLPAKFQPKTTGKAWAEAARVDRPRKAMGGAMRGDRRKEW